MFEIVILSSVCKIIKQTPQKFDGDKQYVATGDLKNSEIISSTKVTYENRPSRADCTVNAGDVLFAKMAGTEKTLVAKKYHEEMLFSTGFAVLRPVSGILDSGFLYHILRSENFLSQKDRMSSGATQRAITNKALSQMKISIPPLMEQKRIAAILDKTDEIEKNSMKAHKTRNLVIQSTFYAMFGDPGLNERGYDMASLSKLGTGVVRNGLSPSSSGQFSGKVLTLSAITQGHFQSEAQKEAMFDKNFPPNKLVQEKDFLICRGNGNINLVGQGVFPTTSFNDVMFPDTMIAFEIDRYKVEPSYLDIIWKSTIVRNQIKQGARTTNGTYKVNQQVLKNITFPLPPIDEQREFTSLIEKMRPMWDDIEEANHLSKRKLKQSLTNLLA
jgi:type I restriction enzyme, S subunit